MNTLIDLFCATAELEKTAIVYRTGVRRFTYSYREIYELAGRMTAFLKSKGVKRSDKVIIWAPNSSWWAVSFFGTLGCGAVIVPIDFVANVERVKQIAELTKAKLIIQSQNKFEKFQDSSIPAIDIEDLEFIIRDFQPAVLDKANPDELAEIIYTSGTTGTPKGVALTHKNILTNVIQVNKHIVVGPEYNFLSLLPLSHMFEQTAGFLTPFYLKAKIIYIRTLKPSAIMQALAEEDVYAVVLVPRLLQLLKNSIERELEAKKIKWLMPALAFLVRRKFGRNFKMFISGGAALSIEVAKFWKSLGLKVVEGYGLTECSPVLAANTLEVQNIGSVGTALLGVKIKIVDGEILAQGENIFSGYFENESATKDAFTADGWFKTGDLGQFDKDHKLWIKGRRKDLIVTSSGVNVHPEDIEKVLHNILGVKEACVVGLNLGQGEEVHAVIVPLERAADVEKIIQQANKLLDSSQEISSFTVWPSDELPKTTTLKVQKFKVLQEIKSEKVKQYDRFSDDKLINLIAKTTAKPVNQISEHSVLVSDLGLTSVARLELVNYIEQEFRVDLEDAVIDQNTTVEKLRQIISKREKYNIKDYNRFWPNNALFKFVRSIADKIIMSPGIRHYCDISVDGLENLSKVSSPVIFISNHLSYFDQPCIYLSLPRQFRSRTATAAWQEFFFQPGTTIKEKLKGRLSYYFAVITLNLFTLSRVSGFKNTLSFMGKLVDRKISILIFPEWKHSPSGELMPFKDGIGIMVKELQIPVVPIKIVGIDKVFHTDAPWPGKGPVLVKFGQAKSFTTETPARIVEICHDLVLNL